MTAPSFDEALTILCCLALIYLPFAIFGFYTLRGLFCARD